MIHRFSALLATFVLLGSAGTADVIEVGLDDRQISDMELGTSLTHGSSTAVVYNPDRHEYLVVWSGSEGGQTGVEIYGQRLDATNGRPVGPNDFRISDMGVDGDSLYYLIEARNPAVVYNPLVREYLVVWDGDDLSGDHFQIHGQRLDEEGNEIGANDFLIGPGDPDLLYTGYQPSVAFNPDANEYLVVWGGASGNPPTVPVEVEISGQRLDGSTGAEVGVDDFLISQMGPPGDWGFAAWNPDVVYNAVRQEYLVVFMGSDDAGALVSGEFEIYGQRLSGATAQEVGPDDFRISDVGSDGDTRFSTWDPVVAWGSGADVYLVAWHGDDDAGGLVDYEFEVFGQLLDGTGTELGTNDFRISFAGPDGDTSYGARSPDVAYDAVRDEFLVVWGGSDDVGGFGLGRDEIFAQRLMEAGGVAIGSAQRLSASSTASSPFLDASAPSVVWCPTNSELLVPWNVSSWPDDEPEEIFVQRILVCDCTATAAEVVRVGSPPNPVAFLPGATSGPVVGGIWDPYVDHSSFLPGAIADYLVVTERPANVSSAFGTILCDLSAAPLYFPPASPHLPLFLPIPANCDLVGATYCVQVGSSDGAQLALTNALDVTIGAE